MTFAKWHVANRSWVYRVSATLALLFVAGARALQAQTVETASPVAEAFTPPEVVSGVVWDADRKPVAGAEVFLSLDVQEPDPVSENHFTRDHGLLVAHGQCDASGRFRFDVRKPESVEWEHDTPWHVWAIADGYALCRIADGCGRVFEDAAALANLEAVAEADSLPRQYEWYLLHRINKVPIEMVDPQGRPVVGKILTLSIAGSSVPPELISRVFPTGVRGTASLADVKSGPWYDARLKTEDHGVRDFYWFYPSYRRVNDESGIRLVVRPWVNFRGQLVTKRKSIAKSELANRKLTFLSSNGASDETPGSTSYETVVTDADGKFVTKSLALGRLTQVMTDRPESTSWRVFLPHPTFEFNTLVPYSLKLSCVPTRTVKGRLQRSDGTPLPGVRLSVSHGSSEMPRYLESFYSGHPGQQERVTTDKEGRFEQQALPGYIVFGWCRRRDPQSVAPPLTFPDPVLLADALHVEAGDEAVELPPFLIHRREGRLVDSAGEGIKGVVFSYDETGDRPTGEAWSRENGTFVLDSVGEQVSWKAAAASRLDAHGGPRLDATSHVRSEAPLRIFVNTK